MKMIFYQNKIKKKFFQNFTFGKCILLVILFTFYQILVGTLKNINGH